MTTKILPALLILMFTVPLAFALQGAGKPTPKPTKPTPKPTATTKPTPKPEATPRPSTGKPPIAPKTAAAHVSMADLVFTWPGAVFLFGAGLVAFALGAGIGATILKEDQSTSALRGLEALLLAVIGGLLARVFIALLLSTAGDLNAAQIAVGWGFFIFPGAVDTIAWWIKGEVVTSVDFLVWMATIVGAFTGLMNGFWQIHNWKGLGWLAFPLDMTWGLAGATLGSLLHLINFAWAGHADETREEAHRYISGFRFKGDFAQTQGPVMSNLNTGPGSADPGPYRHERTHVWQNRVFGPLFTLSYLGWMAIWIIPAAIAAIVTRDVSAIEAWCYFNNPWELWGFKVGHQSRTGPDRPKLVWGNLAVLILSILYFAGVVPLMIWIVLQVW